MINKVINLRDDDPDITLTTYVQDEGWKKRDAILVIPGGGYSHICSDREGEPIAMAFAARGVNAFVLKYSINEKAVFPRPLIDASLAMKHIKEHSDEYHIDPERVFCTGFSAGGHLAASLGTFWNIPELGELRGINRPCGMILCYAVLVSGDNAHKGSFYNILGTNTPTDEELSRWSIEKHIDDDTAPAFFVHTSNDPVVPVQNSLETAAAMAAQKKQFELHIYPDGPHGIALGDWQTGRGDPRMDDEKEERWVSDAVYWMKNKVK